MLLELGGAIILVSWWLIHTRGKLEIQGHSLVIKGVLS